MPRDLPISYSEIAARESLSARDRDMARQRITDLERKTSEMRHTIKRLRAALSKIAFITGGIDTPATSNAAHYEATNALAEQPSTAEQT